MTPLQPVESAHAPCTSTIVGFGAGCFAASADCADETTARRASAPPRTASTAMSDVFRTECVAVRAVAMKCLLIAIALAHADDEASGLVRFCGFAACEGEGDGRRADTRGLEDEHDVRADVGFGDLTNDACVEHAGDPPDAATGALGQRKRHELPALGLDR